MSELEIFTSMYEDWVGFVQNTLAGHWIIYIIVLVDMIVTTSIAISTTDVISLAKPLNQWKVWAIWLFGGLWGAHWLCLIQRIINIAIQNMILDMYMNGFSSRHLQQS